MERLTRIGAPTLLALALCLFLLPFLSVSCDAPGGFGRMDPGGTTSYTGLDLAIGSAPSIDSDHLRIESAQQDDDLGVQPLITIAAIGIISAVVLSFAIRGSGLMVAAVAGASSVALLVGELLMRSRLVDKVAEQTTEAFDAGKSAGDFVAIGPGFWLAWVATTLAAVLAFIGTRLERPSSIKKRTKLG